MLSCYILDDEQNAVDTLIAILNLKFKNEITILGYNVDPYKAIKEIELLKPNILFIDVEMPKLNGLEVLKQLGNYTFKVIFTTAHEKYALPALKASAIDYLVKPLSLSDIEIALKKIKLNQNLKEDFKINISCNKETLLVHVSDIIRIEAESNYSHFYFINQPKLIVSKTLKEFEELLGSHNFCRIHQSHLINLKYLISISTKNGDKAILENNHQVEISRRRKSELLFKLKNI